MDFFAGLIFAVMMNAIWPDEAVLEMAQEKAQMNGECGMDEGG